VSFVVWLLIAVAPALFAGVLIGYVLGRHAQVQRRVDAVLRSETRPRHPSARESAESLAQATGVLRARRTTDAGIQGVREPDRWPE